MPRKEFYVTDRAMSHKAGTEAKGPSLCSAARNGAGTGTAAGRAGRPGGRGAPSALRSTQKPTAALTSSDPGRLSRTAKTRSAAGGGRDVRVCIRRPANARHRPHSDTSAERQLTQALETKRSGKSQHRGWLGAGNAARHRGTREAPGKHRDARDRRRRPPRERRCPAERERGARRCGRACCTAGVETQRPRGAGNSFEDEQPSGRPRCPRGCRAVAPATREAPQADGTDGTLEQTRSGPPDPRGRPENGCPGEWDGTDGGPRMPKAGGKKDTRYKSRTPDTGKNSYT